MGDYVELAKQMINTLLIPCMEEMTDEERLEVIAEIESRYCRECGRDDPSGICQCWNDE